MTSAEAKRLPCPSLLNALFRLLMIITRKHGLLTLSRCNSKLFPNGELIRLATGNLLYIPGDPHFIGYILGRHEHHLTRLMRRRIRPGDLCVDAGANIGYFSAIMASLAGPQGEVISFEPEAANFAALAINARLAADAGLRIRPQPAAVSSQAGTIALIRGSASTLHQVQAISLPDRPPAASVNSVRIDQALPPPRRRVAFLKMDVEGHEQPALEGCSTLLEERLLSSAVVEVTPGATARGVGAFLRQWNPRTRAWLQGKWVSLSLQTIPRRCDVWLEFET